MNKLIAIGVGALLLLLLILFSTTYQVRFHEIAVKTRFGQAADDSVVSEPGLHWRLPVFIDRIKTFDKRLQLLESPVEWIQTADQQQVLVQAFLMWRIDTQGNGPRHFSDRYASIDAATESITGIFRDALAALSRYQFNDLIGADNRLREAEQDVLATLTGVLADKGVLPVSVGISQVLLPPKTTSAVLQRMEATRAKLAEAERFKGQAEASRIRSEASTIAEKIRSFAAQRAEEIRLDGERAAAKYLEQMSQDEDLAIFLLWRDALEDALSDQTTLILSTGFEPFHLLDTSAAVGSDGIPRPRRSLDPIPGRPEEVAETGEAAPLAGKGE